MDYLMIVIAAGKAYFVSHDTRSNQRIVRRETLVTATGTDSSLTERPHARSQLYFTLASPLSK